MVESRTTNKTTMTTTPISSFKVVVDNSYDDDIAPYDEEDDESYKKKIAAATTNAKRAPPTAISSSSNDKKLAAAEENEQKQQQRRRRTSTTSNATNRTTRGEAGSSGSNSISPKKNNNNKKKKVSTETMKKNGGSTLLPPTATSPRSTKSRTTTSVIGSSSSPSTKNNKSKKEKKSAVAAALLSAKMEFRSSSSSSSSKTKMDSLLEENKNWGLSFSKRKSRTASINRGSGSNISSGINSSNELLKNNLSMASALLVLPTQEDDNVEQQQQQQQQQEEGRSPTKKKNSKKKKPVIANNDEKNGSAAAAAVAPPALLLEDSTNSTNALLLENSPSKKNKKKKSIIPKQAKNDLVVATAAASADEGKRKINAAAPRSPPDVSQEEEGKHNSDDDDDEKSPKKERITTTTETISVESGNNNDTAAGAYSSSVLEALSNSKSNITEAIQRITSSSGTSFGRIPDAAAAAEDRGGDGDGDDVQPNVKERKKKMKTTRNEGFAGDIAAAAENDDWDMIAPPPTTSLQRSGRLVSTPGAFACEEITPRGSENGSGEDDAETGRGGASSVSSDGGGGDDENTGDVEEGVQGELGGQQHHHSSTILTAEIVDEETEQNRLKEAEELGRRSVLASAVVAQQVVAVPDEDAGKGNGRYDEQTASTTGAAVVKKNWYRQHPRFFTAIVVAVTGLVAAVIVAGIVAANAGKTAKENEPKASSSQAPIPPTLSTAAPSVQEETDPEPMSVDFYHSGTNNHVCADAVLVADGSRVSFGGRNYTVDEPTEHIRDFEPCTKNDQEDFTELAWYSLYGTGMDITATVCIDHIDHEAGIALPSLHVYTGECTGEYDYPNPSVCHDLVVLTDYDAGRCRTYSWSTLEDFEYFIAVADDSGLYMLGQFELIIGSNDSCEFARPVMPDGSPILGSTALATRFDQSMVPQGTCGSSSEVTTPGLWHSVIGTGETFSFDTCFGNTGYDFEISVYEEGGGSSRCSDLRCIGGSDNAYGCLLQASVSWVSSPGVTYYVLVHGGQGQGPFVLKGWTSPVNDICQGATPIPIDVSAEPTMVKGTTTGAKARADAEYLFGEPGGPSLWCDPVDIDYYSHVSPGVWYRIDDVDAGVSISVSACNENSSTDGFAPNIQIFVIDPTGSCDELFCAPATYGSCGTSGNQQQGQATWVTEQGETYYIFVYGTNEDEVGDFDLKVTSTLVSS